MKKLLLLSFFILINLQTASSGVFYRGQYRIGLFKDQILDANKITHVIIVGSAVKEDSNQFFQTGVARAQRFTELWPHHQVVFMSSPEVRDRDDQQVFDDFNIPVIKTVKASFTGERLISELRLIKKIASIDFFGHSSPWGLKLGKTDAFLDPSIHEESLKTLRGHFTANAFMTTSGCNSGFIIAPELSRLLEIPVSGSLTSSVFERIQSDGFWYKEDDWPKGNYIETNEKSFEESLPCKLGVCWRMKPTRFNYSSYWGTFTEGGLSFYKFFCNFESFTERCEMGMAASLLAFPSVHPISLNSSEDEFKSVAFDWLCSTASNKNYFNNCVAGIENAILRGDLIYQSHPGNELICDFKSCKAKIFCKDKIFGSGPKGGTCKLKAEVNQKPTTAARELQSLLKGFHALKQSSWE